MQSLTRLLAAFAVVSGFAGAVAHGGAAGAGGGDGGVWFEDLAGIEPLLRIEPGITEDIPLIRHVADRLLHPDRPPPPLPEVLMADGERRPAADDREPRMLFISASDGRGSARVALGRGEGIVAAIDDAVAQLQSGPDRPIRWVRVDTVQEVAANREVALHRELAFDRTLVGVAFERHTGVALLPEELLSRELVDRRRFQPQRINDYIAARRPDAGGGDGGFELATEQQRTLHYFSTQGWYADGDRVHRLYRGHRQWDEDTPWAELHRSALETARLAGDYLLAHLGEDGRFNYIYFPATDRAHDSYSSLRHAGATEALVALHALSGEAEHLEAARRAIDYQLKHHIQPMQLRDRELWAVREGANIELGGAARLLSALAAYTQASSRRDYIEPMRKLADWLVVIQATDGRFRVHRQNARTGQVDREFQSAVYPGEAALALVRMHQVDPDDRWLGAARRAVDYLMQHRDVADGQPLAAHQMPHDVGQALALCELYRETGHTPYRDRAVTLAGAIMRSQQHNPMVIDHAGSFARPLSREAARRAQAICHVALMLADDGDDTETQQAVASLTASATAARRFIMPTSTGRNWRCTSTTPRAHSAACEITSTPPEYASTTTITRSWP